MEIILKQDVKSLGEKDDIVNVKPGYARNFLIPKSYAVIATPSNRKILAENLRQVAFKQDKLHKDALALAEGLKDITIVIGAKAGESGKIFGAVNALQIAEFLKKHGFEVDRRKITLESDVKFLGSYLVNINLHKEVKLQLPFEVVAE
jgi:large subunit ribosomal protein L9